MSYDGFSLEPPKRRPLRKLLLVLSVIAGTGATASVLALFFFIAHLAGDLPSEEETLALLSKESLALTTEVFDRQGRKIGEFAGERRYFVPLAELPEHVKHAFLSAEDKDFRDHWGISPSAIVRAALENFQEGGLKQGASTITQQLVRLTLLHRRKVWSRKIKEALLALALESRLTKDEILELYLNRIFLGNHSYGIESAARNYFRKSARDLNLGEAALLAGLPKAPSRYAPHRHPARASRRQAFVLKRMVEDGFITEAEADRWTDRPVAVEKHRENHNIKAPYFIQAVRRELARKFEFERMPASGLKIYTTLDLEAQEAVHEVLTEGVARVRRQAIRTVGKLREVQGAVISIDPLTGGVRAMQGGASFADSQFNRSAKLHRRIGGLFLPVILAVGLEHGLTATSPVLESPGRRRSSRRRPELTMYEAAVEGRTLEGARLFTRLGAGTVLSFAKKLGLVFERDDIMVALGYGRSSPLEVAAAYASFAAGGRKPTPYLIEAIVSPNGEVLYQNAGSVSRPVMALETAAIMTHFLRDAVRYGHAHEAAGVHPEAIGMAAATDDMHNSWFAGSLPHLTTVVWVGAERGRIRLGENEQDAAKHAARLWKEVMEALPEKYRDVKSHYPGSSRLSFARHPRRFGEGKERRMVPFVIGTEPTRTF